MRTEPRLLSLLATAAALAVGCASTDAARSTKEASAHTSVVPAGALRLSPDEAGSRLHAAFAKTYRLYVEGIGMLPPEGVRRVEVLDDRVRLEVGGRDAAPAVVDVPLSDPLPRIEERGHLMFRAVQVQFEGGRRITAAFEPDRLHAARELLDVLANLRSTPLEDPALVARFEAAAAQYRGRQRPELPQDARRFKVQAELAVEERRFSDAAELFKQALTVAPWWPEGHYNRALVLGELGSHALAIRSMKRYLALVPDAPDAQAAQDRIYAWEAMAERRSPR